MHYNRDHDVPAYLAEPSIFAATDGYMAIPTAPGLGISIDEEAVRRGAEAGHRWRPPLWRHADGSFAEW
jgi:galactonate dehydratase